MNSQKPVLTMAEVVIVASLLIGGGCSGTANTDGIDAEGNRSAGSTTATEVLQKMVDVYQGASAFSGRATVRLSYDEEGRRREETAQQEVTYIAPNKLELRIGHESFELNVACDGTQFVAQVNEELSQNLNGQVIVRPAPERITIAEFEHDQILFDYLNGAIAPPMQTILLLTDRRRNKDNAIDQLLDKKLGKQMLEDDMIDGRPCYRVQVDAVVDEEKEGFSVFWVDRETHLLRRLEHPTKVLAEQFGGEIDKMTLQVDYQDITLDPNPAETSFQMEIADQATTVGFFVPAPPKEPLDVELYGKRPAALSFKKSHGGRLGVADLQDQVTVLAWIADEEGSRLTLQQLVEIRKSYSTNEDVACFAVATDNLESAAAAVESWGIDIPVVLDDALHGRDTFRIQGIPTLIVLGRQAKVQYAELGMNARLAGGLTRIVRELLDGQDVAAREVKRANAAKAIFSKRLEDARLASLAGSSTLISLERPKLLPPKSAEHLQLTKLWSSKEVVAPGNITISVDGDDESIFVFDGWRTVVELDITGKVIGRHSVSLPERQVVSYLRTAVDGRGKRWFAASTRMGLKVHVFDESWQLKSSYPSGQEHEGIRDVQLGDIDGDGTLELAVGFWGLPGVHGVSLAGENTWRNRAYSGILSLALSEKNDFGWRKILATGTEGGILRLNQFGRNDPPYAVSSRNGDYSLHYLYAASYSGGHARFCGISVDDAGRRLAVGLTVGAGDRLVPIWEYQLPAGIMTNQMEAVTSADLFGGDGGQWLLAGPDGSLHVVSHDVAFHDALATGKYLRGLAAARIGGRAVLLISTETDDGMELSAWQVER